MNLRHRYCSNCGKPFPKPGGERLLVVGSDLQFCSKRCARDHDDRKRLEELIADVEISTANV